MHTHSHPKLFLSICIFENHEFTPVPPVPVQHHGVYFSLPSFLSFFLAMLGLHCFVWLLFVAFIRGSSLWCKGFLLGLLLL